MATKERFTVNIDVDQFERLRAERHGVSLAWLGRQAITQFLADEHAQSDLLFPPLSAAQRQRERSA